MGQKNITDAYRCDECKTWHDDYDEAQECCSPIVWFGHKRKCTVCETYYREEEYAAECCHAAYTCPACQTAFDSIEEAEE